ncbi:phospholipase A1 PLIP2, chloroplastic-like isoform X2 [Silene latifolia]|uniref:phospholipase A1 PLIP2, chloroplastic-like isoform X2 n=1 Tax=Silene latifolia TaxID=37657 RepID=UPI003D78340A
METKAKGDDQSSNVRTSTAYQIAANAASYLHTRTEAILPSKSLNDKVDQSVKNCSINSEMASLMATTDSTTTVIAAKEDVKQAVVDDLSSISSSPCEWFVCDMRRVQLDCSSLRDLKCWRLGRLTYSLSQHSLRLRTLR